MKKQNYFMYGAGICLILWVLLFLDRIFLWQGHNATSRLVAQMEIVVNLIILVPTYQLLKKLNEESKKIFLLIFITNIGIATSDVLWYGSTYLSVNSFHEKLVPFIADLVPFYIWTTSLIIFLWKVLNKFVFHNKSWLKIFLGFAIVNFIILSLFLSSIHTQYTSSSSVMQIIIFISYLIVFDFAALSLIYTESFGLLLFLSGIIILISGDFFLLSGNVSIYSTTSHSSDLRSNGELLFLLGVLLDLAGISMMMYQGDNDISKWFRRDTAIKSKLAFWCFGGGIVSFLLFFIIAYIFSAISREVFLGLPLFIMIYSVVVIIFSLYMGEYFEAPFKQIAGNIKLLMLGDKNNGINSSFSTEEFVFLQKFILDAFKDKDEKDTAQREAEQLKFANEKQQVVFIEQEKFKTSLGQMLHDIQSPLSSLSTIVAEQSASLPETTRITLRNATNRIGDIANNMLNQFDSDVIVEAKSTELLVSLALLQIMSEKRYEYHKTKVTFEIEIKPSANFAFIKINPDDFKRMISNIINNAVEALKDKVDGRVNIKLNATPENIVVFIKDNGYGMPQHIIEKFEAGIAVTEGKENGHGIGLTQIRDTIDKYDGTCSVFADEGVGTEIVVRFPLIPAPHWIASEINLAIDDVVVILDDDSSIHGAWKSKFAPLLEKYPTVQTKYCNFGKDIITYINNLNTEQKSHIFLLTDYELLNQGINGLDVVKSTGIKRAILVTSHSANLQIQAQVIQSGIKILAKELTSAVTINVDKKIPKHSRIVDMVWVEDQKEFVDDMVREYYGDIKVDVYYDPESFLADVEQYSLNTRFILDTYYYTPAGKPYLLDGFAVAQKLHEMGYSTLILFSGQEVAIERKPHYLKVILKNDLINRKNLHKV